MLAFCSPGQEAEAEGEDLRLIPRPQGFGPAAILETARAAAPAGLRADRLAAPMAEPFSSELEAFEPDVVHVTSGRLAGLGRILAGRPAVLGALDAMHLNFEARALVAKGFASGSFAPRSGGCGDSKPPSTSASPMSRS